MSPFAPFTEDQFRQMAMCKARAYTWDDIAETVNIPIEIVERVAWTHEKQWNCFLTKAERHIARETIAEVAGVLRKDIRNAEPQHHATLANSLSRILKLQQEYAPKKRPRRVLPPAPVTVPEVRTSAPTPPADLPPPTPKMTTDEMLALKKRIRARIAGAACALFAFVCLCGLLFGRVALTNSSPTLAPVVAHGGFVTASTPQVAAGPPDREGSPTPLAPAWRAPPGLS